MCSAASEERLGSWNRVVESEAAANLRAEYCEGRAENSDQERRAGGANQECKERKK